jgi:hypothetical protein
MLPLACFALLCSVLYSVVLYSVVLQVRVWDIRNRICRAFIRLDYSIISLAFQPGGGAHIGIGE